MGGYAFDGCSSLTTVDIPTGVTNISTYAFYGCSSLTSVTISTGITSISDYAFYGCSNLTSVAIPVGTTNIGSSAFMNCSSLTNIVIPVSVKSIGSAAFRYCYNLISITIPNGVTSIGIYAFAECYSLTNLDIPVNLTAIPDAAFKNCSSLIRVVLPESITSIGSSAFSGCYCLRAITIPSSVTSIGSSAFEWCSILLTVNIPASVKTIGDSAFVYCTGVTNISVVETNTAFSASGGVLFNKTRTTLIQYPAGKVGNYTVPATVTKLGYAAFAYDYNLHDLIFSGDAPLYVLPYVFEGLNNLTIYCMPSTDGWGSRFAGCPVTAWSPFITAPAFNADSNAFSFKGTGSSNMPVAIESSTNMVSGPWIRMQTTNFPADFLHFTDQNSTYNPVRFYRISGP